MYQAVTLLFLSLLQGLLLFPIAYGGNVCKVAPKLAPVIAAYGTEELLDALKQKSESWKATRDKFRASYLQSNGGEEATKCLSPMVYSAVDDGDLIVAVSMYNDNDDEEEMKNAAEFERKSLMGIAESTYRMIENLRSSSDRSVSVFVLSSHEMEGAFDDHLCGAIVDCRVNYLIQGPINAFVTMCASDLLVMTAHGEMAMYAAALCSNHAILAPSSLAYVDVFSNRVFADTVHLHAISKNEKNQIDRDEIFDRKTEQTTYWMDSRADNYTIDILTHQQKTALQRSLLLMNTWDLPTCRDNEVLEPKEKDLKEGKASCSFRPTKVDLDKMKNDFDILRWASDICEAEFHEGNEANRRLFSGYRTASACVTMLYKRVVMLLRGSVNSFEELRDQGRFDVRIPDQSKTIIKKDFDEYMYSDTMKYQSKYNVKCESNWMYDLTSFEQRVQSQGGQDGVLGRIFEVIGTSNQYYVELGFNAPLFTAGSNTFHLYKQGWKGLLLDNNHENPEVNLRREYLTTWNVVSILEKYKVPHDVDYISIDIDSQDIWILKAIIGDPDSKFRPRVISIEYNGHFPLAATVSLPPNQNQYDPIIGWDGFDMLYGASAGAIKIIANMYGYEVVHMIQYYDMFLVRRDLLEGACPPPFASFVKKAKPIHYCVVSPSRKKLWIDVETYLKSDGDVKFSQFAAQEQLMLLYNPSSEYSSSPDCAGFDVLYSSDTH